MSSAQPQDGGSAARVLERSMEQGRLGHAYLLVGGRLEPIEQAALRLAKALNCLRPVRRAPSGFPLEACDDCRACRQIADRTHPDVHWLRPESKTRVLTIDQVRDLLAAMHMKPLEGRYKVAVLVAADRLNASAANAFLKTLEEPPPNSILLLLTTEPQRVLETVASRCLRLNFASLGDAPPPLDGQSWLTDLAGRSVNQDDGLLGRYRLLAVLLTELAQVREQVAKELSDRSLLRQYRDVDPGLREQWEDQLEAAIEAEYRRLRAERLALLEWWLRDVWLVAAGASQIEPGCPGLAEATRAIGRRLTPEAAAANVGVIERTQRLLNWNVQEALALEVGLLQLNL